MAGLVFDLGQMFVSKTELQNAADACALAAARELNTTPTTLAVLTRAENAGITTGKRNKVGFQDADVTFATDRDVTFSASFVGGYVTKAGAPLDTRYARCSNQRTGIAMWFMQVLGMGDQQVASTAVASLQGSSGEGGAACCRWASANTRFPSRAATRRSPPRRTDSARANGTTGGSVPAAARRETSTGSTSRRMVVARARSAMRCKAQGPATSPSGTWSTPSRVSINRSRWPGTRASASTRTARGSRARQPLRPTGPVTPIAQRTGRCNATRWQISW